LKKYKSNHF